MYPFGGCSSTTSWGLAEVDAVAFSCAPTNLVSNPLTTGADFALVSGGRDGVSAEVAEVAAGVSDRGVCFVVAVTRGL